MSTNADTIRGAVEAERNRLVPGTVEKYPAAKVSVRILDVEAVLAEVEQLRAALEQIAGIDRVKYVEAPLLEVQRIARGAVRG